MPSELLTNSMVETEKKTADKRPTPTNLFDVEKLPKKPKVAPNPNNWHPKLKEALEGKLKEAGNPSFTKVMNYCKKDAYGIFAKGSPVCVPNAFFGNCYYGDKCTKKHVQATDAQVKPILALLEKFTADPSKLKSGQ